MANIEKSPGLPDLVAQQTHRLVTQLADSIHAEKQELLSIWGMTPLQFDALYALYSNDTPLSNNEISAYIHTRVPDMTRLLDRMTSKGWIQRSRDPINRRTMRATLTDIGKTLVESALHPLIECYQNQMPALSPSQHTQLITLLQQALTK